MTFCDMCVRVCVYMYIGCNITLSSKSAGVHVVLPVCVCV
jgi:hypothetical protein